MPHDDRPLMQSQPLSNFDEAFKAISSQPHERVTGLKTTGGVIFDAYAKTSPRVGKFILLPDNNRIYPCCWGNTNNHMGKEGQRIGQYTRPIDKWCQEQLKNNQ